MLYNYIDQSKYIALYHTLLAIGLLPETTVTDC